MSPSRSWQITYEIHLLEGGRWTVFFSSPEAAEARGMLDRLWERPEVVGLRLVKEIWDPDTDRSSTLVLDERRRRRPAGGRYVPHRVGRVVALPEPAAPVPTAGAASAPIPWPWAALSSAAVGVGLLLWGLLG